MNKRVCKDDQIKLIMKCRQSGLSDYQWCEQNGIHPGTFYNWVSKLKKSGYSLPDTQKNSEMKPEIQEVVKVDLIDSVSEVEQNVSLQTQPREGYLAAELQIGNITLRLFNGADENLIQNTLALKEALSSSSPNLWIRIISKALQSLR